MTEIDHLKAELAGRDKAIDMHLEEIEELKVENRVLRHRIEVYKDALEDIAYDSPSERARRALEDDE